MHALPNIFKATSYTALLGWLILAAFPLWPKALGLTAQSAVIGIVVMLLCVAYSYLVFLGKKHDGPDHKVRGSFWSLKGIIKLFETPRIVLAGWVHYLAFDLMVGVFIVSNAAHYNITHWMLLPCLFMTLLFGPAGLLLYFALRGVVTGEYFAVNAF